MLSELKVLVLMSLSMFALAVSAQELDTAKVDQVFGRPGQKTGEVYKVGFPRTELHVVVEGITLKPGLALGSWAAFSGTDANASVMGDLVLLPGEVNPVMAKLRADGFQITALHNHLLEEEPRVMYMHYMGQGPAAKLASSLQAALGMSKTPLGKITAAAPSSEPPAEPEWVKSVEETVGRKGTFKGGVLSFGVPRAEAITMSGAKGTSATMGGMELATAQGVAESINFQEAGPGKVATTGDFVLTAEEVNPVISALEEHHIAVTALHSHMLTEQPRLFFMHFWAVGSPQTVAAGIAAGLKHVAVK